MLLKPACSPNGWASREIFLVSHTGESMTGTTHFTVPELQVALRLAGLPPAPTSPFADLSPPATIDPGVVSTLRGKNVVNGHGGVADAWREVLATLASPTYRVWLYLGSADRWETIDYYSGTTGLIGYASTGAEHLVTFPCTTESLSQALERWLGWDDLPDVPHFLAELQAQELVTLAAVVDAHREESLRAFLERRQPDLSRFSREQLLYELETAAQTADPRWFAGILQRHAPAPFRPSPASLDGGAGALGARGLLTFEGNDAVVTIDLAAIAAAMASLSPYAVLSVGPAGAPGTVILMMRALQSYWTVDFLAGQNGQSWARLQGLGGPDLQSHIRQALATLPNTPIGPAAWTAPLATPPPPAPVTAPAARVHARAAQESSPMKPALPQEPKCAGCGKPLAAGRKFCTSCGTPTG
jgi:hypothetical protein